MRNQGVPVFYSHRNSTFASYLPKSKIPKSEFDLVRRLGPISSKKDYSWQVVPSNLILYSAKNEMGDDNWPNWQSCQSIAKYQGLCVPRDSGLAFLSSFSQLFGSVLATSQREQTRHSTSQILSSSNIKSRNQISRK